MIASSAVIASTVNVPNPSSTNYVFKTDTDGSNNYGAQTLWGIAGDYEADINSSHQLLTASSSQGIVASGSADTDIPLNGGGRAATGSPTLVTDGQKVASMMTVDGKTVVVVGAPSALRWQTGQITTTTATTLLAANATLKTYLTDIDCGRVDAGTTAQTIDITDGASNNMLHMVVPDNGGGGAYSAHFISPKATSATNSALGITVSGSVSESCSASGYYGP